MKSGSERRLRHIRICTCGEGMNAEVEQRRASLGDRIVIGLEEPDICMHLEQKLWRTLQTCFSLLVQTNEVLQQSTHAISFDSSPDVEEVTHRVAEI